MSDSRDSDTGAGSGAGSPAETTAMWWERAADAVAQAEDVLGGPAPLFAIADAMGLPPCTPQWEVQDLLQKMAEHGLLVKVENGWRLG